jgi:hypothetical protein
MLGTLRHFALEGAGHVFYRRVKISMCFAGALKQFNEVFSQRFDLIHGAPFLFF